MGNPQERLLGVEYLAGLIEGEGCFCLGITKRDTRAGMKVQVVPIFALFMSDAKLVQTVSESLKHLGIKHRTQVRKKAAAEDQLGVEARGMERVQALCLTFIPYLYGRKKQAARLTLAFILSRLSKPQGSPFSEEEIAMIGKLRETNGNHRGRKTPTSILRDYTPSGRSPRLMRRPMR